MRTFNNSFFIGACMALLSFSAFAQKDADNKDKSAIKEAQNYVADGNAELAKNDFAVAETSYRQAVAKNPESLPAKYNMGNNYYENKKYAEGMSRYAEAVEVAKTKAEKHSAYHNLGNALYQQKDYKKAVEAYKNALRNDPTDEQTRYNLALAKKEDKKNGGGGKDNKDDKDKNKDKKDDKDKSKDGDGKDKKSDDGKPKKDNNKGDDKKKEGNKNKDDQGKPDDKKGDQKKPGDKDQQPQQPQQGKGQLSPQQVKSLLEAMKNEENKVQEKMNAQKVKGAKVKTDKDW